MNEDIYKADENKLIRRVAEGDKTAFKELYVLTHKKVYFYLFRMTGNQENAEDIMAETYTEVWKNASKFRGDAKGATWVIGIARNLAMNSFRKTKYHDSIDDHPNITSAEDKTGETMDRKRLIKAGMQKLSENHREIMDLVFFQEFNYQQVADVLGIPVNTVKTRVFHAKAAFKAALNRMGVKKDDV
ncbi:MAG: RNA polymerase sigma factor [Nitrospinota bacterium]